MTCNECVYRSKCFPLLKAAVALHVWECGQSRKKARQVTLDEAVVAAVEGATA